MGQLESSDLRSDKQQQEVSHDSRREGEARDLCALSRDEWREPDFRIEAPL